MDSQKNDIDALHEAPAIPSFDYTGFLDDPEIKKFLDPAHVNKLKNSAKHDPYFIHLLKKINPSKAILNIIIPLYCLFILIFNKPPISTASESDSIQTLKPFSANFYLQYTKSDIFLGVIIINYLLTLFAFFIGYHKYFTHHTFQTDSKALQFIFAIFGASVGVGSIWEFSSQHLLHHFHTDTEKDPFNAKHGWLFHMWGHNLFYGNKKAENAYFQMMKSSNDKRNLVFLHKKRKDQGNFNEFMIWQHRNYSYIVLLMIFVVPMIVSKILHVNMWSCIFYLGLCKMSIIQQQWFLGETLGHHWKLNSCQSYDDSNSSMNCGFQWVWAFFTFGETQHNFHHEFPGDYRNSNKWYVIDFQKWIIYALYQVGLVTRLHTTNSKQIRQAEIQQEQRNLDKLRRTLLWGVPIEKLPIITAQQFSSMAEKEYKLRKRALVCVEGIVHDVTPWVRDHPGGPALIEMAIGKDASDAFNGGVYLHSKAARNLMANMRIAVVVSNKDGVWGKSSQDDNDQYRLRLERNRRRNKTYYAAGAA
ncbi:hypothetical protein ACO0QE_000485 [Hanseniaspora vineae]